MKDTECVNLLQWALPRLKLRWPGYRKVRRQVCKRIGRRLRTLELDDIDAYRAYLATHPDEWGELDAMCRITISRFHRDRGVFDLIRGELLPELARNAIDRGDTALRCWSVGCGSGEEAYSLAILWVREGQHDFPAIDFQITASDVEPHMLKRARSGCYSRSSLAELPNDLIEDAFDASDDEYRIHDPYRDGIEWVQQDVRHAMPTGLFDLVLCRNLVFTYFVEPLQRECLTRIADRLFPNGFLVLGKHETLPEGAEGFIAHDEHNRVYQKA